MRAGNGDLRFAHDVRLCAGWRAAMLATVAPSQSDLANPFNGNLGRGYSGAAFDGFGFLHDNCGRGHSLPLYFLRPADGRRLLRAWPHLDADGTVAFRSMVPAFGDSGGFGVGGPDRDWHAAAESTGGLGWR